MKPVRVNLFILPVLIIAISLMALWAKAWGVSQKQDAGIPETVTINVLSQKYIPVLFPHQSHAEMSGDCVTCHHHSPEGETLACKSCHSIKPDIKKDDVPSLKAAYHLQCVECHRQQDVELSRCTFCHAQKQTDAKVKKEGE